VLERSVKRLGVALSITALLLSCAHAAATKYTLDPTEISLGGYTLSLGRTYVAAIDNPHGLFMNPAQLGSLSNNSLTLTGTQMLGEIYRFYGGGSLLLNNTTSAGLGLVYANESGGNFRNANNASLGAAISYTDAALIGGIGHRMGFPFSNSRKRNIYVGANAKYFYKSFSGVSDQTSGFNMDLGVLYRISSGLRLGLHAKNLVAANLNVSGPNNITQAPEQQYIYGLQMDLFGKNRLFQVADQTLTLGVDAVSVATAPTLFRAGLDWGVIKNLNLRLGAYQDYESSSASTALQNIGGVNTYLTMGVGYKFDIYTLNYAYQPNDAFMGSNHFITVTVYDPVPLRQGFTLNSPKDKLITYDDNVDFIGHLVRDTGYVLINGQEIGVSENLSFKYNVPLKLGRNKFIVEYYNDDDELVERHVRRILRMKQFDDVPQNYFVRKTIEEVGTLVLISTPNQKLFEPTYEVERKEIVSYLVDLYKLVVMENEPREVVAYVKSDDEFSEFLVQKSANKFVLGYPDGYLRPNTKVTRAEGASLFLRFHEFSNKPIAVGSMKSFKDLKTSHWAAESVAKAREAGLIHGGDLEKFEPNRPMKKVEMTLMMARTYFVKKQIEALYDWEKY
jgi:hypothetical protein